MRTYHLTSSLVSLCLLLGSCTLGSIDPDVIDIADTGEDEIGDADEAGTGTDMGGDGDGDTGETGISESSTGSTDQNDESDTEDSGDTTDDGTDTADASTSDATDSGTTSDTTGTDDCQDVPVEGECTTCLVDNCCDQVLACLDDDICACYYTCYLEGQACGADECGPPTEAVMNLGQCAGLNDCQSCL